VFAPNVVLGEERVPLDADELATLVAVQAQDRLVELLLEIALNCVNALNVSDFFQRRYIQKYRK
jgi:hypothetical protein